MKVYGITFESRWRLIVAAKSRAAAVRAFTAHGRRVSDYMAREYGGWTGNEEELRLANEAPGRVLFRALRFGAPWHKLPLKEGR